MPLFRCKRQMQTQEYLDRCHILLLLSVTLRMQMIMPSVSFVSAVPWVLWIVLEAYREMNSTQLLWELQMGVQDLTRGNYNQQLFVLDQKINHKKISGAFQIFTLCNSSILHVHLNLKPNVFLYRFATTVIVVDVTGTAVNQGPSFTAGTYNILVSEGIPSGSSVFASPVSHYLFQQCGFSVQ